MKKFIIFIAVFFVNLLAAQNISIKNIKGEVYILRGLNENIELLKSSESISDDDLIITGKSGSIVLTGKFGNFSLESNAAVYPNKIKNISREELLLKLTMEQIRKTPVLNDSTKIKSTVVYGDRIVKSSEYNENEIGIKKFNGAYILAIRGFRESGLLFAQETMRKYPYVKNDIEKRLFFADLMTEFKLYEEALSEYQNLLKEKIVPSKKEIIDQKIDSLLNIYKSE